MKVVNWIVILLVTILLVCFALANRNTVSLGLWPLVERLELRLFIPVMVAGLVGFLAGGFVAWSAQSRWRRLARERGRRNESLAEQVRRLEARLAEQERPAKAPAALPAATPTPTPALRQVGGSRA